MRSVARSVHLAVAWLLVAGLVLQIFLAGLGVFRGPESFLTHRDFGYTLELLPIILLVAGLIAGLGRRAALLAAGIFGLFLLQSVFVGMRADAPEVAALHPVNGFLITFLAIVLARDAWMGRRAVTGADSVTAS
jgi:mercuric ion transport protein